VAHNERIDAYAQALFEIAKAEGSLFTVEDQLFKVARTLESNDQLRSSLTDEAIPIERRQGIVDDLLVGRANPTTVSLVSFIVTAGRGKDLAAIIDSLVAKAAAERQQVVAEVRSIQPLSEEQISKLEKSLSKRVGKNVTVKVTIDPTIVGGLITQIDDFVIDGSVRNRLEQFKDAIRGSN
jgi:F-type H+-transporting ATPase subunit delta